jgi:carboxymethylenebutenolidase
LSDAVPRAAIALYDRFTHGGMDRRAFMAELTRVAGGTTAASLLLTSIGASAQAAPQVATDDPRLRTLDDEFRSDDLRIRTYRAIRKDRLPFGRRRRPPTVIVIHENRGLNEHIRDVTRRVALAGYNAVAPDFLSLDGAAAPADEDAARTAIGALDTNRAIAAGAYLARSYHAPQRAVRPFETQPTNVGIVGFCWGGAMVHRIALAAGDSLAAAVSFYGPAPDATEAPRLMAPELVILAGRDARVNATAGPWVAALRAAGKDVTGITYPDVDHAFHNDTSTARYNRQAAGQAWTETLGFFRRHLGT